MILYNMPAYIVSGIFITLLLTVAMEMMIALKSTDIITDTILSKFIRNFYISLMPLSLVLLSESWIAISGIEGGIYLFLPEIHRYFVFLPLSFLLYGIIMKLPIRNYLSSFAAVSVIPILMLPVGRILPISVSIFFYIFVIAWLTLDAIFMLVSFTLNRQNTLGFDAISELIFNLDVGICLLDSKDRVVEFNPAFSRLCKHIDMPVFKKGVEYRNNLLAMERMGILLLEELEDCRLIHLNEETFMIRENTFYAGRKIYNEILINDVSPLASVTSKLKEENLLMENENLRLQEALGRIAEEAASLERERLSRKAHDIWSQRLAIASFSVETLIRSWASVSYSRAKSTFKELLDILSFPEEDMGGETTDLETSLRELSDMYRNMGVSIHLTGKGEFTSVEQGALVDIIKESFANAVRHAYTKDIFVHRFTSPDGKGMVVKNKCLDSTVCVAEGRGLYGIKKRALDAGGRATYNIGDLFELSITFPIADNNLQGGNLK